MSKINNIVKGFSNPLPKEEKWYQERISKCNACEFNTLNGAPLSNACKTLKMIGCPSKDKGSCNQCCCCIEEKASVKAEFCPKEKWDRLETNSDQFKLELMQDGKVKYRKLNPGGEFVIELGKVDTSNLKVVFETTSILKNLNYESVRVGCSCTASVPHEIKKGRVYKHEVNISLSVYGEQNKNMEINFIGQDSARYTVPIKIKFNRVNTNIV